MERADFAYDYDAYGYMLKYKGKPLGGAASMRTPGKKKHWRHVRADQKMFRENAEEDIERILAGRGQPRFIKVIKSIDRKGKHALTNCNAK